jgi:threonine/homoserine/homoserine lactone efflux protein
MVIAQPTCAMTDPLLFVLAVVSLLATPGPTNTLLATAGAARGVWWAAPLVLAELAGYLTAMAVLRLAIGPLVATTPAFAATLKGLVAVYLVVLAIRLWRLGPFAGTARTPVGAATVFLTTCLNPKALVFTFAILPFGTPASALYLAGFAVMVMQAGLFWVVIGDRLAGRAGFAGSALVPRLGAAALTLFAGLLGVSLVG